MKTVFLTGASGFLGRHCLPHLAAHGYEIHATFAREPLTAACGVQWHACDLLDSRQTAELIRQINPTHLLHLAWNVQPPAYWTSPENLRWVEASLALFRAFAEAGGSRVVGAGTCAEYDWGAGLCHEEKTPLAPTTLYGASKHCLQALLQFFADGQELSAAWGRIFFLYGPHEHPGRLVPSVIRSLLKGEEALCSEGRQIRDFLFIDDAARAFVQLLDSDVTGAVNIASGRPMALRDLVQKIGEKLGRAHLIRLGALPSRPQEPPGLLADVERLTRAVGWSPAYDLESAIGITIDWWQEQLSRTQ